MLFTYPLNSFAKAKILGIASGSSAIIIVENRERKSLCSSESEVPRIATPTYALPPTLAKD